MFTIETPWGSTVQITRDGEYVSFLFSIGMGEVDPELAFSFPEEYQPTNGPFRYVTDQGGQTVAVIADAGVAGPEPVVAFVPVFAAYEFERVYRAANPEPTPSATLAALSGLLAPLGVGSHVGYAPTGAALPYICVRPLFTDNEGLVTLDGDAISWGVQYSVYCAGESVDASYNLATAAMNLLQGAPFGDSVLDTTVGYIGAPVEGHYESQVTATTHQGGI